MLLKDFEVKEGYPVSPRYCFKPPEANLHSLDFISIMF